MIIFARKISPVLRKKSYVSVVFEKHWRQEPLSGRAKWRSLSALGAMAKASGGPLAIYFFILTKLSVLILRLFHTFGTLFLAKGGAFFPLYPLYIRWRSGRHPARKRRFAPRLWFSTFSIPVTMKPWPSGRAPIAPVRRRAACGVPSGILPNGGKPPTT